MQKFTVHNGLAAPLARENIDTDVIIPKQFLKSIRRVGFGPHLFDAWRYLDTGYFGKPANERRVNTDFILNQPRYAGASILLTGQNFGCGSSREHAPWALHEYGFRAVIAPSFADIFHNNSFKSGLLPVILPASVVQQLIDDTLAQPHFRLTVDLERCVVLHPNNTEFSFEIAPSRRERLLKGLDDIGLTLQHRERIAAFETQHLQSKPWLQSAQHVAGTTPSHTKGA